MNDLSMKRSRCEKTNLSRYLDSHGNKSSSNHDPYRTEVQIEKHSDKLQYVRNAIYIESQIRSVSPNR